MELLTRGPDFPMGKYTSLWVSKNEKGYHTFYKYVGIHETDEEFIISMEKHFNDWVKLNLVKKMENLNYNEIINYLEKNFEKLKHERTK